MADAKKSNVWRIVFSIFVATALVIFFLITYKESTRKYTAKPLHTPLPEQPSAEAPEAAPAQ